MCSRLPVLLLLASALVFLASLYLPWRSAAGGGTFDGWAGGSAAALFALALVASSAAVLLRPRLALGLPLGGLGVGLAYFAAAVVVQLHDLVAAPPGQERIVYGWAYGVYLGSEAVRSPESPPSSCADGNSSGSVRPPTQPPRFSASACSLPSSFPGSRPWPAGRG